jgi:hypothetical protein
MPEELKHFPEDLWWHRQECSASVYGCPALPVIAKVHFLAIHSDGLDRDNPVPQGWVMHWSPREFLEQMPLIPTSKGNVTLLLFAVGKEDAKRLRSTLVTVLYQMGQHCEKVVVRRLRQAKQAETKDTVKAELDKGVL